MKRHRPLYPILYISAIVMAGLITFLHIHLIKIKDSENPYNFSALNVAEDIKIISKKPHSIEHPNEKKVVREYLSYRLRQLNGNVKVFEYDSIASKLGGYMDIANIYAVFDPPAVTDSTQYVILTAHYDSRFRQEVLSDTVFSYGAADDGYGVGVTMELVRVANNYHNLWNQGIKVLFTDAEEHEMDGMRNMMEKDPYVMENVNLVINIEARGVRGPALLFETSEGNGRLVDFYKNSGLPYGYSLTSLVYGILPNNTDFSVVKNDYPGYNFAVVDNLKFYHTDRDNYSNISLESIQHYGAQINPLVKSYLLGRAYGDKAAFESSCDKIFFTMPLLGLFSFSKAAYIVLNIVTLLFTLFLLYLSGYMMKITAKGVLGMFCRFFLLSLTVLLIGTFAAYLAALSIGVPFNPLEVKYFKYDNLLFVLSLIFAGGTVFVAAWRRYLRNRHFCREFMASQLVFTGMLSFVSAVLFLDNFIFLVPLAMAGVSFFVSLFSKTLGGIFHIISGFIIALSGFSFFYLLYVTVTIGSLGFLLFLAAPYIGLLVAQLLCVRHVSV